MVLTAGSAENLRDPIDLDHGSRLLARRRGLRLNIRPRWQYLHSRFSSRRTAGFPNFFGQRRSIAETRGAWRCCFEGSANRNRAVWAGSRTASLSLSERGGPAEIIVRAHRLHHDGSDQNEDNLQKRFR